MEHSRAERAASRALRFGNLEADKQPEKQTTEKGRVDAAEIPSTSKPTPTTTVEEEQLESGAEKESWQEKAVTMDLYQSSGSESEPRGEKEAGKKKEDASVDSKEPQGKGEKENKMGEKTGGERGRARERGGRQARGKIPSRAGSESEGEKGAGKQQGKEKEDTSVGSQEPQRKGEKMKEEGEKTGSERGRARERGGRCARGRIPSQASRTRVESGRKRHRSGCSPPSPAEAEAVHSRWEWM